MEPVAPMVHIVDDDAGVRTGLERLLRVSGWSTRTFATAASFLEETPPHAVGCIVLDINMPGMSGPELHEALGAHGIDMPVLYLTGEGTVPTAVKAMKLGAMEYFEKPVDIDVLLVAVERAVDEHRRRRAATGRRSELERRLAALSPREREVMNHIIVGRLNKQIAADLGIAEKTVKVHRGRVMHKIGVRSVAQLVRICEELEISKSY